MSGLHDIKFLSFHHPRCHYYSIYAIGASMLCHSVINAIARKKALWLQLALTPTSNTNHCAAALHKNKNNNNGITYYYYHCYHDDDDDDHHHGRYHL